MCGFGVDVFRHCLLSGFCLVNSRMGIWVSFIWFESVANVYDSLTLKIFLSI